MNSFIQIVHLAFLLITCCQAIGVQHSSRDGTNNESNSSVDDSTDGISDLSSGNWADDMSHSKTGDTGDMRSSRNRSLDSTVSSSTSTSIPSTKPPASNKHQPDSWHLLLHGNDQEWSSNFPPYRQYYHISSYKRDIRDKLSKLLLVGGLDLHGSKLNDTWIYSPWSNSWFELSNGSRLTPTYRWGHQVMPTLCNTFVLLINSIKDVWAFDGHSESWSRVAVYARNQEHFPVEGAVALRQSTCHTANCSCSESVFMYGRVPDYPGVLRLYELRCEINRNNRLQCDWKEKYHNYFILAFKGKSKTICMKKTAAHGLMAVADNDRRTIYFSRRCLATEFNLSRKTTLFKFDLQTRKIRRHGISHGQACYTNMFLWNNSQLVFAGVYDTSAVLLQNISEHQKLQTNHFDNTTTQSDVILNMQSVGPVRIHWFHNYNSDTHEPHIYVYHVGENSTDSRPYFVQRKKSFPPQLSPGFLRHQTSVYGYDSQTFYVYGGLQYDHSRRLMTSSAGILWTLTMPSNTWWFMKPQTTPSAYISSCGTYIGSNLILFGGQYDDGSVGNELWIYNTNLRNWCKSDSGNVSWPLPRAGCSISAFSRVGTVVLFGGYSNLGAAMSDVWLLHLTTNHTSVWRTVKSSLDTGTKGMPYPRFGHSTAVVGQEVIIYGGETNLSGGMGYFCLSDMWALNVSGNTWRELVSLPRQHLLNVWMFKSFGVTGFCDSFLLPYGLSKIAVWQGNSSRESLGVSNVVWMIDTTSRKRTDLKSPFMSLVAQAAGIWNGSLVYYGRYSTPKRTQDGPLMAIGHSCRPGSAQRHGPTGPCVPCPIGQYSITHLTVSECTKCPPGTTTNQSGISSIKNCICDKDYCAHGTCEFIGAENDEITAVCRCSFGFVGEQCDRINYVVFVMAFGILAVVVAVTTVLAGSGVRIVRHRRARRQTEWELNETRKAFTIASHEIELLCRLDQDCPGGYGQVRKAVYRDWTVAVKQLQVVMAEWVDIRREFLREIHFMRTVRHPNIVMFIGAGQYDKNHPFLVLEFMSGGALRSLLKNVDIQLTSEDQLQFMLDTAEGMKYLHTLQPPRIHRDLKSANLLLSNKKQVKVADFGSARLVPQLKQTDKARRPDEMSNNEGDESQLLTENKHLTSHQIGTARWRSPEMWQKKPYGTATDIYSFAIVAWEILTRQTPFSGRAYRFDAKVEDAVLAGTRPDMPLDTPQDLSSLIQQCWQEKADDRPQFTDIVPQLRSITCKLRCSNDGADAPVSRLLATGAANQLNELRHSRALNSGSIQAELHELVTLS